MAELVSLKLTPKEVKAQEDRLLAPENDGYPWGLSIHLEDEQVQKLGLDPAMLKAGQVVQVKALAIVRSVQIRRDIDRPDSIGSVCLQLTDMAVSPGEPADKPATSSLLYGE